MKNEGNVLAKMSLVGAMTSTDVTPFNQQELLGKQFRIYGDADNPLFLAKDVAEWIEHNQPSRMMEMVDEEEKLMCSISMSGQNREMWMLTEDGLYEVLMQSRKPIAKEFKREIAKILSKARASNTNALTTVSVDGIDIVQSNDEILVDSRSVAENFGKEHKNVLRILDDLVAQNSATKTMFHQCTREYRGQQFRYFTMNRDGFSLLVMGFTGKEALDWKLKYIAAFNAMEKKVNALPDFTNPAIAARAWADAIEAKQSAEAQVAELAPKAEFYDTVADSSTLISMGDAAKLLNIKGIGRNTLFRILRDRGVLQWDNVPYQRYIGYFEVKERCVEQYGEMVVKKTTFVTQRGLEWLRKTLSGVVAIA